MKIRNSESPSSSTAGRSAGVEESRYFAALGLISFKELERRRKLREAEAAAKRFIEQQLTSTAAQSLMPPTERMRTRHNGVRKAANPPTDATWKRSEESPTSSDAGRKSESPLSSASTKT
uniref:Uncharacterized protein n=1 Tax=Plectus sambesii TaxID=2011161 RepID=A0A914VQG6_9BILA